MQPCWARSKQLIRRRVLLMKADWFIEDPTKPKLKHTVHPFQPVASLLGPSNRFGTGFEKA